MVSMGIKGEIEAADCPEQKLHTSDKAKPAVGVLKRGLLIEKEAMNSAFYG